MEYTLPIPQIAIQWWRKMIGLPYGLDFSPYTPSHIIIIIIINVKINVALSENASRTRYTEKSRGNTHTFNAHL